MIETQMPAIAKLEPVYHGVFVGDLAVSVVKKVHYRSRCGVDCILHSDFAKPSRSLRRPAVSRSENAPRSDNARARSWLRDLCGTN
jgi:hypothetical protein